MTTVPEALHLWSVGALRETLAGFNEAMAEWGRPLHELQEDSVECSLALREGSPCPEGHSWNECFEATAPRPVLRMRGLTTGGQLLVREADLGDSPLETLLESVVRTAGGVLTARREDL